MLIQIRRGNASRHFELVMSHHSVVIESMTFSAELGEYLVLLPETVLLACIFSPAAWSVSV